VNGALQTTQSGPPHQPWCTLKVFHTMRRGLPHQPWCTPKVVHPTRHGPHHYRETTPPSIDVPFVSSTSQNKTARRNGRPTILQRTSTIHGCRPTSKTICLATDQIPLNINLVEFPYARTFLLRLILPPASTFGSSVKYWSLFLFLVVSL